MPQNSLFKTYKELKRHWKNSYGYRLPDSEEGMMYATVKFGRWFSESLTYPIVCVRARRPVFLRQLEPERVLLTILADLHGKVPMICGYPFGIDATVRYALPKLNVLTEMLFPCNLSETKPNSTKLSDPEEQEDTARYKSLPVSQCTQSQHRSVSSQAGSRVRSCSPPPFLPRLSQLISGPPTAKSAFVPIFTPKTRAPPCPRPVSPSNSDLSNEEPLPPVTARPMFGGLPLKPIFGIAQPAPSHQSFYNSKPVPSQLKTKSAMPIPLFGSASPNHPFNFSRGEKTLLHLQDSAVKKSRNKPQVQPGVDIKALAQTRDGLNKVNTTTLIAYLRSEGVPCKVKDKKGDLVNKVLIHLKLPLPQTPPPTSTVPRIPSSPSIPSPLSLTQE